MNQHLLQLIKNYIKSSFLFNRYGFIRQQIELLKWNLVGRVPPVPHIVKQRTVNFYAREFSLDVFVETGTYLGVMVNAIKNDFKQIFSVELDHALFKRAQHLFSQFHHITLLEGDSAQVLPVILEKINRPTLFWLDAHYSGGITSRGSLDTPIMMELEHIFKHRIPEHVVLIDDAREFVGQKDYPALAELQNYIRQLRPNHIVKIQDDIIQIYPRVE